MDELGGKTGAIKNFVVTKKNEVARTIFLKGEKGYRVIFWLC